MDQATKAWALSALGLPYSTVMEVLPVLNLRLGFNTGVTFGVFRDSAADAVWVLVAVSFLVVGVLVFWLWRTRSGAEAFGLSLVIGGAPGNILDRLRQGAVTDFLDAHFGDWHWPTFNVADVGIVCGVGLLISALRPAAPDAGHATPAATTARREGEWFLMTHRRTVLLATVATPLAARVQDAHQGHAPAERSGTSHDWHGPLPTMEEGRRAEVAQPAAGYRTAAERMGREMDAALTGDPDRDFLASLVPHARGAIELARMALRQAGTPEIRALAETVIRSREEELRDWEALLARLPGR